jgi:hypothetical protein
MLCSQRHGISFLAALRVRWQTDGVEPDEREVVFFGLDSYDPGGRSGDPHASEAVGGDCQTSLLAIGVALCSAAALGANESQLRLLHASCVPVIEQLHGRRYALDWTLQQVLEAFVLREGGQGRSGEEHGVTPYPVFLLHQRPGKHLEQTWSGEEVSRFTNNFQSTLARAHEHPVFCWGMTEICVCYVYLSQHAHTRAYLSAYHEQSFDTVNAVEAVLVSELPRAFLCRYTMHIYDVSYREMLVVAPSILCEAAHERGKRGAAGGFSRPSHSSTATAMDRVRHGPPAG